MQDYNTLCSPSTGYQPTWYLHWSSDEKFNIASSHINPTTLPGTLDKNDLSQVMQSYRVYVGRSIHYSSITQKIQEHRAGIGTRIEEE